ncbi:MAG TPA: TadE/TadG family type IV pilus assembly protein [Caulobacteraceae bacterium]|jgi:Flp pilus assembly protein TadG|nr:TadE/TadG family type IV pilus assembly protein [Caulobacteraceae bacterium]
MPTAFLHRLRKLPSDDRAATAVEFAILITPLLFLILASLQLGIIFFATQCLQSAAMSAGRQLMTGSAQDNGDSQQQFIHNAVCPNAPVLFDCNSIMVDVQSASAYSSISTTPLTPTYDASGKVTNKWSYSPGAAGDIVIVRLMYNWPVVAGPLMPGLANQSNGNRLLVATSVFKNEPYQ